MLVATACLKVSEPNLGSCDQSTAYVVGDTVSGALAAGDCKQTDGTYFDFYAFQPASQASLRFTLSSPSNQAILLLYDQRGAIIANSALSGTVDTTASLRLMLAPTAYALAVNGAHGGGTGPYRFVSVVDTSHVGGCGQVWVTPGITTAQRILSTDCTQGPGGTAYYYHVYDIVVLNTQVVTFTEQANGFPPAMILVGPTGSTASSVDSTGAKATIEYASSGQGLFQLWVGSSAQLQQGTYTLTIE